MGGDHIKPRRIAEATGLLTVIRENDLHSHLPKGTPTHWPLNYPGTRSTLDLTLSNIPTQLLKCQIYPVRIRSPSFTYSEWDLHPQLREQAPAQRLYQCTNWDEVGKRLQMELLTSARTDLRSGNDLTPLANPCPYSNSM